MIVGYLYCITTQLTSLISFFLSFFCYITYLSYLSSSNFYFYFSQKCLLIFGVYKSFLLSFILCLLLFFFKQHNLATTTLWDQLQRSNNGLPFLVKSNKHYFWVALRTKVIQQHSVALTTSNSPTQLHLT